MSDNSDYWQKFWAEKSDPLTGGTAPDHDLLHGELRLILPKEFNSVIEIGCGSGDMYEPLGFNSRRYHGLDFSPAMIEAFNARYPEAKVEVRDLRDFDGSEPVDLIFSHAVVQFISLADFAEQVARSARLLKPGGHIIHASALRKACRDAFLAGELLENMESPMKTLARRAMEKLGMRHTMGFWYDVAEVRGIAKKNGLKFQAFGSLFYPYRFHIVLQKPE